MDNFCSAPVYTRHWVTLSFSITNINSFDITNNILSVSGFVEVSWTDDQLSWRPEMYGGLTSIPIIDDSIWRPNISQFSPYDTSMSTGSQVSHLRMSSGGEVLYISARQFPTSCRVDVFIYPFDQHVCDYTFVSPIYHSDELTIKSASDRVSMIRSKLNGEWNISDTTCIEIVSQYPIDVSVVSCDVTLTRRPGFTMLHATLPLLLLTGLTCMVFWLPANCGERIAVSVTLFLAYTVILARVSGEIPRNSVRIPLYSLLLVLLNAVSAVCVAYSILVVRVSMTTRKRVPRAIVKLASCLLCRKTNKTGAVIATELRPETEQNHRILRMNKMPKRVVDDVNQEITWLDVAKLMDYLMFVIIIGGLCTTVSLGIFKFWAHKV